MHVAPTVYTTPRFSARVAARDRVKQVPRAIPGDEMRNHLNVFACGLFSIGLPIAVSLLLSSCSTSPIRSPVLNDPFSSVIVFRLVDTETGKTVGSAPCQMTRVFNDESGLRYWCSSYHAWPQHFGWESSPVGLVVGTYRDFVREPLRAERQIDQTQRDRPDVGYNGNLTETHLPVPRGYEPDWDFKAIESRLLKFARFESREVIELGVRTNRTINGKVVDARGNIVPNAETFAIPAGCDGNEAWLRGLAYFYDGESPWEGSANGSARMHASVIGSIFETNRPMLIGLDGVRADNAPYHEKPNEFRYTASSNFRDRWYCDCNDFGEFRFTELPRGKWLIGAYDNLNGFTTVVVDLSAGSGEVVVRLPDDQTATLNLSISWEGALPKPEQDGFLKLGLDLGPCDPYGVRTLHHTHYQVFVSGSGPWNIQARGIRPGWWSLSVGELWPDEYIPRCNRALLVAPDETRDLNFTTGPAVVGRFELDVLVNGTPIDCKVQIESTDQERPEHVVYEAAASGNAENRTMSLFSGRYKASVAGVATATIEIESGKTRKSSIEIPLQEISFTLDRELSLALGDSVGAELSLSPQPILFEDGPPESSLGFRELAVAAFKSGAASVHENIGRFSLESASPLKLRLPAGLYHWALGEHWNIRGALEVVRGETFHFGIDAVPGARSCILDCSGLVWPELDDYHWFPDRDSIKTCNYIELFQFSPSLSGVSLPQSRLLHVLADRENKRVVLFSSFPSLRVRFEFSVNELFEDCCTTLSFPGFGALRRNDFSSSAGTLVEFTNQRDSEKVEIAAFDEGGIQTRCVAGASGFRLKPGRWTILFKKQGYALPRPEAASTWCYARQAIVVGDKDLRIDLSDIAFQPAGLLRVELAGRAPTNLGRDPWWHPRSPDQATTVRVVALEMHWGDVEYIFTTRMEFLRVALPKPELRDYANELPPGRYKIIPWPGAPDSACKIVTVEPGKECVVRFEGR